MNLLEIKANRISVEDRLIYDQVNKVKMLKVSYGYTFIIGKNVIFDYYDNHKMHMYHKCNNIPLLHSVFTERFGLDILNITCIY